MGMGSAINLAGNYFDFSSSSSESEADNRALESDWGMVGQDIQSAREKIIKRKSTAIQQEISF